MPEPQVLRQYRDHGHYWVVTAEHTGQKRYAFYPVDDDRFDAPVVFVGDAMVTHYPAEKDAEGLPDAVLEALDALGVTLITGVDAGWRNWGGRPEFSDRYIDTSEAERV